LAFSFYGLFFRVFWLLNAPLWIAPTFAGTTAGCQIYDLPHYATPHWRL
jgi:hypothetical protein